MKIHAVLDTSAFVKRYLKEKGSETVREFFKHPRSIVVHLLDVCIPEVRATFHRKYRTHGIPASLRDAYLQALVEDISSRRIFVLHLTHRILEDTDRILKIGYRGVWSPGKGKRIEDKSVISPIDALVLSAAWHLDRTMTGVVLVTSDDGQEEVAKTLDLEVVNPARTQPAWVKSRAKVRPGPR